MHRLQRLGSALLDSASSDVALEETCHELYAVLSDASGLHLVTTPDDDTSLRHGYALHPQHAARCLLDVKRTVAFLRGLWDALGEIRRRAGAEQIEIVYAGTGPFATLALPLLPLLPKEPFAFTFIDVHANALDMLRRSVEQLQLDVDTRFVHADAAHYTHPAPIHIALTETLQQALTKEPFVSVVWNLQRQLHPRGLLIPERVVVSAAAIETECVSQQGAGAAAHPERHLDLGPILRITRDQPPSFDPVTLAVPDLGDREHWLGLLTSVEVFGGHRLEPYDSGLTMPRIVWSLSPLRSGDVLEFTYLPGSSPDFHARRIQ